MTGRLKEARRFAEGARVIAQALGDFPIKIGATFYRGASCCFAGDYERARDFLQEIVQSLKGDLARERYGLAGFPAVFAHAYLAWICAERGEFEAAFGQGRDAIRLAEAVDHPYSLIIASWPLAYIHVSRWELGQALDLGERAVALARDWDLPIPGLTAIGFLGHAYALSGRIADGVKQLEESVRLQESIGFGYYHSLIVAYLGEAYLLGARFKEAVASAKKAIDLARKRGERSFEAWSLRLLGKIDAHRDPPDVVAADAAYRQALALAQELGMRPLAAHCHLGLGQLSRRTGERAKAEKYLATATAMYREMDMRFWLEKVETADGAPARPKKERRKKEKPMKSRRQLE